MNRKGTVITMPQQPQENPAGSPNKRPPAGRQGPKSRVSDRRGRKTGAPRKRRRANTGCLSGVLYFLFVVGVSTLLAGFGWLAANEVLGLTKPAGEVTVEIKQGDTITDITNTLKEDGLIQYPWLFKLYANITHAEANIVPGTYTVSTNLDYMAIVGSMKKDSQYRATVKVTIPEGFTEKQIIGRLAENKVCDEGELWQAARMYNFSYSFLEDLPKTDNRLEGYLFPDTYEFYIGESAVGALDKMLSNFDLKFTANMRARAEEMDLTIQQAVTIASMIEREAANADEAPKIASVIYNRLHDPVHYPYLAIDATILYVLPEHKTELTQDDLNIDSPYNTRNHPGLPPGPICSPGKSSMTAALDPDETDYYYYAINKDGVHQFARTADEFQKIVDEARAARGDSTGN